MNMLKGKVALITGASAGIGQATAMELAAEGANLILTARRKERLEELAARARELGAEVEIVPGDAREEETARAAIALASSRFGRLDILINNAGIGNYKPLVETTIEDYEELMDSNVRSTFLFTRHAVPLMLEQRSGTILMIASMAGIYGYPNETVYCASKFAQVGFAQSLDKEFRGSGIKAGVICPGATKTEFAVGKGRTVEEMAVSGMLEADDVAKAILFACTQPTGSRIIELRMRAMNEPLTGPGV